MADYQTTNFHFRVSFLGLPNQTIEDIKFQSVSGLSVDTEFELYKEGGENRFEHFLPIRRNYQHLILERGVLRPGLSGLTAWCKDAFDNGNYTPIDLVVESLGENHTPLVVWKVVHTIPISWRFGALDARQSEVLLERFELRYNYFEFRNP